MPTRPCTAAVALLLLAVWASRPVEGNTTVACNNVTQAQALQQFFQDAEGLGWTLSSNTETRSIKPCTPWNFSSTFTEPCVYGTDTSTTPLPVHCCFCGLSCRISDTPDCLLDNLCGLDCNMTGSARGTVYQLDMFRANLKGNLSAILNQGFTSALSCSLTSLQLGSNNNLTGPIPENIGELQKLQHLQLGNTNVTGTLPSNITELPRLKLLDVSNTWLEGTVPSSICRGNGRTPRFSWLTDLILSSTLMTGDLFLPDCTSMINLDISNSLFLGETPSLSTLKQLHIVHMQRNNFSRARSLNFDTENIRYLAVYNAASNRLTGTIPENLGRASILTSYDIQNNSFTGTIPPAVFQIGALTTFNVANNTLTGTLPPTIGEALGLSVFSVRNNRLHGSIPDRMASFWKFNLAATVDMSVNYLSCCGQGFQMVMNATGHVVSAGYTSFNDSAPRLPAFLRLSEVYQSVQDTNPVTGIVTEVPGLRCPRLMWNTSKNVEDASNVIPWFIDPEYYYYENCTCVEGFTKNWVSAVNGTFGRRLVCTSSGSPWYQDRPWLVALIIILGIILVSWLVWYMFFGGGRRSAVIQQYINMRKRVKGEPTGGKVSMVVTDIEGYSDLMKQSPELMTKALNIHNALIRKARWNNFGYTVEQEGDSYSLVFYDALDAVIFCLQTQQALNRQVWPEGLFRDNAGVMQARKKNSGATQLFSVISNVAGSIFDKKKNSFVSSTPEVSKASVSSDVVGGVDRTMSTSTPPREPSNLKHSLFNGMRVRMGIATGDLPVGSQAKGSAVMDKAKVVSDAGSGGQILMDEQTFHEIKERLEELGAVDHNGMNYKKLNAIKPPWYMCWKRKNMRSPDDALLLDMGEYMYTPAKKLPLYMLDPTKHVATPTGKGAPADMLLPEPPAPKGPNSTAKHQALERLRLYQVVPPVLVQRVKVFLNKLALKEEWVMADHPYFSAPGTLEAPVGLVSGPLALPPITMAFCIVENGKTYSARFRRDAVRVHDIVAACIYAMLRVVPGGYFCRQQDGDLKYMVAFASPKAALEWALLLQEVLMYCTEWPESAIKFFGTEYDDLGNLLFRGPRLKIGICEGSPRTIIPDHIGRADYHGASINQAARYMDAAAHGGMIAVEAALALKVFDAWKHSVEDSSKPGAAAAAGAPQLQQHGDASTSIGPDSAALLLAANRITSVSEGDEASAEPEAPLGLTRGKARERSADMFRDKKDAGSGSGITREIMAVGVDSPRPAREMSGSGAGASPATYALPPLAHGGLSSSSAAAAAVPEPRRSGARTSSPHRLAEVAMGSIRSSPDRRSNQSRPSAQASGDVLAAAAAAGMALDATEGAAGSRDGLEGSTGVRVLQKGSSMGGGLDALHLPSPPTLALPAMGLRRGSHAPSPLGAANNSSAAGDDGTPGHVLGSLHSRQHVSLSGTHLAGMAIASRPSSSAGLPPTSPTKDDHTNGSTSIGHRSGGGGGGAVVTPFATITVPFGQQDQPRPSGDSPLVSRRSSLDGSSIKGGDNSSAYMTATGAPSMLLTNQSGMLSGMSAFAARDQSVLATQNSASLLSLRSPRPPTLSIPAADPDPQNHDSGRKEYFDAPTDSHKHAMVVAFRLGKFQFKGNPEAINMVHVAFAHLVGRKYPAEGPKGKGGRVAEASGLLAEQEVVLPDIVTTFKERYEAIYPRHTEGAFRRLGSQQAHTMPPSPLASPFSVAPRSKSLFSTIGSRSGGRAILNLVALGMGRSASSRHNPLKASDSELRYDNPVAGSMRVSGSSAGDAASAVPPPSPGGGSVPVMVHNNTFSNLRPTDLPPPPTLLAARASRMAVSAVSSGGGAVEPGTPRSHRLAPSLAASAALPAEEEAQTPRSPASGTKSIFK